MCVTALLPPPPTPSTLIIGLSSFGKSNTITACFFVLLGFPAALCLDPTWLIEVSAFVCCLLHPVPAPGVPPAPEQGLLAG
jgi:hypothetical protein